MSIVFIVKIFSSFFVLGFGFFTFINNSNSKINQAFLRLTISIFIWLISYSFVEVLFEKNLILSVFRIGYTGIIFIPITFYEFIAYFLGRIKDKYLILALYVIGLYFSFELHVNHNLINGLFSYFWGYYPKAVLPLHGIFLAFFLILFTFPFIYLGINLLSEVNQIQLARVRYVFLGSLLASIGSIDFLPNYGISFVPIGFIFMIQLPIVFTYAVVRYRLMDISIVITRTTIFLIVYGAVLGVPFALAFGWQEQLRQAFGDNWWIIPLVSSTVLASVGPYIYAFIQQRAEDRLLQDQRQYQSTLRKASLGMGRIKNLNKLLQLIVHIVTRSVRIEHCSIFLYHEDSNKYILKAAKGKDHENHLSIIDSNSMLVKHLINMKEPIVYEEIKQKAYDYQDAIFKQFEESMNQLEAALIVPSFIEQRMIAIIVLGKKRSGKLYSEDDLAVFSILSNQAALAIENALFYDDMKKTHEQLFKAEKMATIGTMADGLSHQINNRFHAMGFVAGDALDSVRLADKSLMSDEMKTLLSDVEYSLTRIQDNVKQGGEIVSGLLKYTRKGEEGFNPVELKELIKAAIEMAQFKIKLKELDIVVNFDHDTPKVQGNFTQLQEVFFNIIDNSYDAMMQRKDELKEPGYRPTLDFKAVRKGKKVHIDIVDNGIGVKDNDLKKIFTPFFTTKLSSKKGTGLGMYVIRQIIEENHGGKVEFLSAYQTGSHTTIVLPVASNPDMHED